MSDMITKRRGLTVHSNRSMTVITCILILSIGLTWLISMICLTVVTAQEIYDQLYEKSYDFPDDVEQCGWLNEFYDKSSSYYGLQHERPDLFENNMLRAISMNTEATLFSQGNYGNDPQDNGRRKMIRDIDYPMDTAVLFYDGDGNLIHTSEDDVMFFNYYTEEEWNAGMDDSTSGPHYGWIDISKERDTAGQNTSEQDDDPYLRIRNMYAETHDLSKLSGIRVTGFFEGTELIPVIMHYITYEQIRPVLESSDQFSDGVGSYSYTISELDRTGKLDWQLQFDHSSEYSREDLVTIYIDRPVMWDYQGTDLNYEGKEYENLAALAEELDFPSWAEIYPDNDELQGSGRYDLGELLVFRDRGYADYENYNSESGAEPEFDFIMVTAVRSNPLACAVRALRNIYIVTGTAAFLLMLLARGIIKKYIC